MYYGIILLILTVRAELFHLSGRVAGYSTCPTVCRDYTPSSDQSVTYFPWPTAYIYIDLLPISTTYYTQDTYSFFLDKFQIFRSFSPLPCVFTITIPRIKREILMLLTARRVSIGGGASVAFRFERKPIRFYFEKREEKTIPVNTKKKKRMEVVRDVDYFLRDTKFCSQTWHYCRGIMVGKNVTCFFLFFFFFTYTIVSYFYQSKKKKKKVLFLRFFLIVMEAMCASLKRRRMLEIKKCFLDIWRMKNIFFFSTKATSLLDIQYAFEIQSCIDSRPVTFAAKRINTFVTPCKDATIPSCVSSSLDARPVRTFARSKCSTENNVVPRIVSRIDNNRFEYSS